MASFKSLGLPIPLASHLSSPLPTPHSPLSGYLDVAFGVSGTNEIHKNDQSFGFTKVTTTSISAANGRQSFGLAIGDLNGDGHLDVYFGNGKYPGEYNELHINDGSGGFTADTSSSITNVRGQTKAVAIADIDRDGDLDVYCVNDLTSSEFHRNDGFGNFEYIQTLFEDYYSLGSSAAFGDMDSDGDLDPVIIMPYNRGLHMKRNVGGGVYRKISGTSASANGGSSFVSVLGDVDGDGDLDLLVVNRASMNELHVNDGSGGFTFKTDTPIDKTNPLIRSYAAAFVDIDGTPAFTPQTHSFISNAA